MSETPDSMEIDIDLLRLYTWTEMADGCVVPVNEVDIYDLKHILWDLLDRIEKLERGEK